MLEGDGVAAQVLRGLGLEFGQLLDAVWTVLPGQATERAATAAVPEALALATQLRKRAESLLSDADELRRQSQQCVVEAEQIEERLKSLPKDRDQIAKEIAVEMSQSPHYSSSAISIQAFDDARLRTDRLAGARMSEEIEKTFELALKLGLIHCPNCDHDEPVRTNAVGITLECQCGESWRIFDPKKGR
jgi:TolA-binding protein